MTPAEIRAAIAASTTLQAFAAAGNTQAIATALSAGRTQSIEIDAWKLKRFFIRRLKWRGIVTASSDLASTAKDAAAQLLDLTATPGMQFDFDAVDTATQAMLSALVTANLCTTAELAALRLISRVADPVTHTEVGEALKGS